MRLIAAFPQLGALGDQYRSILSLLKEYHMKTKRISLNLLAASCAFLATSAVSVAQATLIGPSPYLSSADSPFSPLTGFTYFSLENFEDHLLNTPGVTAPVGGKRGRYFTDTYLKR